MAEQTEVSDDALSFASCEGFKQKFQLVHGFKRFAFNQSEGTSAESIRKLLGNTNDVPIEYPYGFFSITSIGHDTSGPNAKNVARNESGRAVSGDMSNTDIFKLYRLQVKLSIEVVLRFDRFNQMLKFVEKFVWALAAKGYNTGIVLDNKDSWNVIVGGDATISIPKMTIEDETRPGIYEIVHQLEITTQIGYDVEVPKLNNQGIVTTNVVAGNSPMERP